MTLVIDDDEDEDIQDEATALQLMKEELEELTKERDFYISKLREIEILCLRADDAEENPFIQQILDILYEPWPFAPPDDAPPDDATPEHVQY